MKRWRRAARRLTHAQDGHGFNEATHMATWEYGKLHHWTPEAARPQGLRKPASLARLATLASLILVLLSTAPYWAARIPLRTGRVAAPPRISESKPGAFTPATPKQAARIAGTHAVGPQPGQPTRRRVPARSFVVSFGSFPHQRTAEARARVIRGKGYHASVTRLGRSFHVLSHTYHDRSRAEFWSKVFGEIGLRTRVLPLGTQTLIHATENTAFTL